MNPAQACNVDAGVRHLGSSFRSAANGALVFALLSVCPPVTIASAEEQTPGLARIRVEIKNLRNETGQVGCALFRSADGFPGDMSKAVERLLLPIKDRAVICEFKGVTPGVFAIASFHDENGNRKLDRGALGPPTEGWGASRDAQAGVMRGPRFENAALRFSAGATTISIRIHYP